MAESILVKRVDGTFVQLQANKVIKIVLADEATKSEAIDIQGYKSMAVVFPGGFTGTSLKLESSHAVDAADAEWHSVYEGTNEVNITVAENRVSLIDLDGFDLIGPLAFVKLVVTQQSGESTLQVILGM